MGTIRGYLVSLLLVILGAFIFVLISVRQAQGEKKTEVWRAEQSLTCQPGNLVKMKTGEWLVCRKNDGEQPYGTIYFLDHNLKVHLPSAELADSIVEEVSPRARDYYDALLRQFLDIPSATCDPTMPTSCHSVGID